MPERGTTDELTDRLGAGTRTQQVRNRGHAPSSLVAGGAGRPDKILLNAHLNWAAGPGGDGAPGVVCGCRGGAPAWRGPGAGSCRSSLVLVGIRPGWVAGEIGPIPWPEHCCAFSGEATSGPAAERSAAASIDCAAGGPVSSQQQLGTGIHQMICHRPRCRAGRKVSQMPVQWRDHHPSGGGRLAAAPRLASVTPAHPEYI